MARTLYPAWVDMNWSEAKWSQADNDARNETKPVAGDTVIFTANSGNVVLDEDSAARLASLDMTGFTGSLAGNTSNRHLYVGTGGAKLGGTISLLYVHSYGDIEKLSGAAISSNVYVYQDDTAADGRSLTCNSAAGGILYVTKSSGTVTAQDAGLWDQFRLTGGASYNDGGYDHTIAGTLVLSAGSVTSSGKWTMSGSGSVGITSSSRRLHLELGDGVTATTSGDVYLKKFSSATADCTMMGTNRLLFHVAPAGWWDFTGTCSVDVWASYTNTAPGGDIVLNDKMFYYYSSSGSDYLLSLDADINTGTGTVRVASTGGGKQTIKLNGQRIDCGDIEIGYSTYLGVLDCDEGEIHAQGISNAGSNGSCELHLDAATVHLTSTLDGSNLVVTNDNAEIHGGTVQNVDLSGSNPLDARHSVTDGGSNQNVDFNDGTHFPTLGSLVLIGVGT